MIILLKFKIQSQNSYSLPFEIGRKRRIFHAKIGDTSRKFRRCWIYSSRCGTRGERKEITPHLARSYAVCSKPLLSYSLPSLLLNFINYTRIRCTYVNLEDREKLFEGVFSDKQRIEKRIYMEKCLVFLIPSDDSLHVRGGDNLIVMTLELKLQAQEEGRGKNNAKIQRMKVEGPWRGRERERELFEEKVGIQFQLGPLVNNIILCKFN